MTHTITGLFKTRREAEMAVERMVQEHGLDRSGIEITSATAENTTGTKPAGGDLEDGEEKTATVGSPALAGEVQVSASVNAAQAAVVAESFTSNGATSIER